MRRLCGHANCNIRGGLRGLLDRSWALGVPDLQAPRAPRLPVSLVVGMSLIESLEALLAMLEAPRKKPKRKIPVLAFLGFDSKGKPIVPHPIEEGDDLYLQPLSAPAAGSVSPAPGKLFGKALEALAAGLSGEIDVQVYEKRWVVDGDPCPLCEENGLAGWIPMDDAYPNDAEPGDLHPNCKCDEIIRREK